MAQKRYKAFISYSHRDKRVANWLHHALETYRLPPTALDDGKPERLHPIFKDREELPAADSLGDAIEQAIKQSDALIVICSPAAAASPWIAREVDLYKRLKGDRNVFPVIVEGDPPGNFPAPLLKHYKDGEPTSDAAEPIAADLRKEGDGRKLAKLKLVAGLSGVDLDTLVQRDAARRQKRLVAIACTALLGMVGTSALALYAIDQRDEARDQRAEADGLIEYMLTDLREQLEPVGRLELLDGVGNRAMDYYARQKLADLSDSELGRRARATMLVAEVQNLRGNNEDALPAFEEAARTTEALLERRPDDPERMFNHGQSLFWVGYIAWQHGKMAEARQAMEGYADISTRLAAKDRSNLDWQMEEAYSLSNLGTMYSEEGKLGAALVYFRQSQGRVAEVSLAEGNPLYRQVEAAEGLSWISTTLFGMGRVSEAIEVRREEVELYDSLIKLDPQNNDIKLGRLYAQSILSRMLAIVGNRDDARRGLDRALEEIDRQFAADPDNTFVRELARSALRFRAMLAWRDGEDELASTLHDRLETVLSDLRRRDADNHDWNVLDPAALAMQRALTDRNGTDPNSLIAISKDWRAKLNPGDPDSEWVIVASHVVEGLAHGIEGRATASTAAFNRALEVPEPTGEKIDFFAVALRGFAARRTANLQKAREIDAQLKELGIDPMIDDRL